MKLKKVLVGILATAFAASLSVGFASCNVKEQAKHYYHEGKELAKDIVVHISMHRYTDVVTPPTCTTKGYTTHTCTCGIDYVDEIVDELGHLFENYVANGDGTETATCSREGCEEVHTRAVGATDAE